MDTQRMIAIAVVSAIPGIRSSLRAIRERRDAKRGYGRKEAIYRAAKRLGARWAAHQKRLR